MNFSLRTGEFVQFFPIENNTIEKDFALFFVSSLKALPIKRYPSTKRQRDK